MGTLSVREAVDMLHRATTGLDALIAKGGSPEDLSLAAVETKFFGAELTELAGRLESHAHASLDAVAL